MDITLSKLIKESRQNFLIISPIVKEIAGSENSAKVITRLEYWFSKYQDGFYKFIEQCDSALCRAGDTWSEEIGLARKAFNKAFEQIGVRYSSKTAYLHAEDKFQGKMYASYYDRKTNRMYYVRNHALVNEIFQKFMDRILTKKDKSNKIKDSSSSLGRYSNDQKGQSFVRTSKFLKQINTSNPHIPQKDNSVQTKDGVDEIIKIWNGFIPEQLQIANISTKTQNSLVSLIKNNLNNNLDLWKNMCREISSNDFLMGKSSKSGWKLDINWLSNPANFQKILAGNYGIKPDNITHVEVSEKDYLDKIASQEADQKVADFRKKLLQFAKVPSYKSWFDTTHISWQEREGAFIFSSVSSFWKDYVETNFKWLNDLGANIEIRTC